MELIYRILADLILIALAIIFFIKKKRLDENYNLMNEYCLHLRDVTNDILKRLDKLEGKGE